MSDKKATDKKKVSSEMMAIIGKNEASLSEVKKLLWAYLVENNLQCEDNKKYFVPDEKMYKVFGTAKSYLAMNF